MNKNLVVESWQLLNKAFDNAVEFAAVLEECAGTEVAEEYFSRVVGILAECRKTLEKDVKQ